jgi:hypothetical protein
MLASTAGGHPASTCENAGVNVRLSGRALDGIFVADFSDPTNERLIYLSAAGLVLVGLALLVGTILWWKRGRQEHPVLAPLEVMGTRRWEKAPEGDRRRRLDHVRPAGAGRGAAEDGIVGPEPVDLRALVHSVPQAFDDLREPGEPVAVEQPVADKAVAEKAAAGEAVAEEAVAEEPAVVEPLASEPVIEGPVAAKPAEVAGKPQDVKVAPAPVDATSISTERPEVVEVLAAAPNESST